MVAEGSDIEAESGEAEQEELEKSKGSCQESNEEVDSREEEKVPEAEGSKSE